MSGGAGSDVSRQHRLRRFEGVVGKGRRIKHDRRPGYHRSSSTVDALHRTGFVTDLGTSLDIRRSGLLCRSLTYL